MQFNLREVLSQAAFDIEVFDDIIDAGPHPEFQGQRNEGFRFYVVATHKSTGLRWEHRSSFYFVPACHSCYWSCPDDSGSSAAGYCSRCGRGEPSRAAAEARASILKARIEHAIALNTFMGPDLNKNWVKREPQYGSQAYQAIRYPEPPDLPRQTFGFSAESETY